MNKDKTKIRDSARYLIKKARVLKQKIREYYTTEHYIKMCNTGLKLNLIQEKLR